MIGFQVGVDGRPEILDTNDEKALSLFRDRLASPDWIKVHFNGINYDEIVLSLHGFPTNPINRHDVFLMAKTVIPSIPAYGLKFLNWWYFGDPHDPERRLHAWCKHHESEIYEAPWELLSEYCMHDVRQTVRLYRLLEPIVRTQRHWRAYSELELRMAEPLHEIILEGGECLNLLGLRQEIHRLKAMIHNYNREAYRLTAGRVTNLASREQVADHLVDEEDFDLKISDKGNLILRKDDLLTMLDLDNPTNDQSRLGTSPVTGGFSLASSKPVSPAQHV